MVTGQVKWFNRAKGFGFITRGDEEDIFVHYSEIQDDGEDVLEKGEAVEFELSKGPRGSRALNVQRLREAEHRPRYESR